VVAVTTTLTGGEGDDVFKFELADSTNDTDTITDFDVGDTIEIADVLPGEGDDEEDLAKLLPNTIRQAAIQMLCWIKTVPVQVKATRPS
jgi:hypothetical protein